MKQIYYALQNIIRGRGSTFIKVASLSLGLFISIILFARVAFELNYDTYYKDSEQIYMTFNTIIGGGGTDEPVRADIYPTVRILLECFPDHVEYGVPLKESLYQATIKHGPNTYKGEIITADSLFFQTMGIPIIRGDVKDMAMPQAIFLSESKAREIFQGEDPLGKALIAGAEEYDYIVKGIFADLPENIGLKADAVNSVHHPMHLTWRMGKTDWTNGRNWDSYIRLKKGADIDYINQRINAVMENYLPTKEMYELYGIDKMIVSFAPLKGYHLKDSKVQTMLFILSLLGGVLLLTASFNYALISISTLPQRAKAIGVHKCNGAGAVSIFAMFFWETFFIILISVVFAGFLIFQFREIIEDMTEVNFYNLFSMDTLWGPALAIGLLFVIGCVLPGRMFSAIHVTQVFRRYTEGKKNWKYLLLFVQFLCTAFLLTFVTIIYKQHQYVMQKDLGYNLERIVHLPQTFEHTPNALSNFQNLPYVEKAEVSKIYLWKAFSTWVTDKKNETLPVSHNYANADFCKLMELKLKEGTYHTKGGEVLVNEEFIRQFGGEVGQEFQGVGFIRGIMTDDFIFPNREKAEPFIMYWWNNETKNLPVDMHIRLKEPFEENLFRLNEDFKKLYPQGVGEFKPYEKDMAILFQSARIFRDSVLIACIMIVIITLTGIIGYTNDEVRRRSKEIAIRKINGAEVSDILQLLCKSILYIALPATFAGVILAKYIGDMWIATEFKDILNISPLLYLGTGILTLVLILGTVVVKAWRVANENPVVSIKNE